MAMIDWQTYHTHRVAGVAAVGKQSPGFVRGYVEPGKTGTTRKEIAEAVGVAIAAHAGAALTFTTRTIDAFDALAVE